MTPPEPRRKTPAVQKGRKSTQRERLLAGMIESANRDGYAGANVSKIIAAAGVSRPTFYDYFTDKDDCFLATLREISREILDEVRARIESGAPEHALQRTLAGVMEFASAQPAKALFLTSQAMAGGPRALDARDEGIAAIEQLIEQVDVPGDAIIPDVSPRALIGGIYRLLASRLRRGEPRVSRSLEELTAWVESYGAPAGRQRWRTLEPTSTGSRSAAEAIRPLPAPGALPPGRPGIPKEEVAANHRARILFAAAQLAASKGYNATTIGDITRLAGVDGRAFYASFTDKQDAFMAVHEIGVQAVMSATASAFFTGSSWPDRMWQAGMALTGMLQTNPIVAHVGFVEAYAVGPGAVQRVEDSHITFTIFLQEGYQQKPRRTPPSRLALEAIITSIFEIVYLEVRRSREPQLTGLVGHLASLAVAPFLGVKAANSFIDQKNKG